MNNQYINTNQDCCGTVVPIVAVTVVGVVVVVAAVGDGWLGRGFGCGAVVVVT